MSARKRSNTHGTTVSSDRRGQFATWVGHLARPSVRRSRQAEKKADTYFVLRRCAVALVCHSCVFCLRASTCFG